MAHLDITVPMRWSDIDGYGHVNNSAMLTLLEEARIRAFWGAPDEQIALGAEVLPSALPTYDSGSTVHTVVASNRIEYARELGFRRDAVIVRLWLSRIGGASLTIDYQVLTRDDPEGTSPYATARTVIVLVDAATGRPTRIDADLRASLRDYEGEPLRFRED
ncbi:acyl-CoA thioesterase [Brachybacterium huguangmaarense]|uniref:Acyl-CoA thioesterase n=1 Tax=Brachybacterium huguangmaarense TaxID=1652028 RepID=A0ABY6G285_9MICO|nr:thioesterase family protein [Brachybacterium huguangmaarense]UYG16774.1 acyl-CoA thioesterase [Brachybacterium huguangmaarense]